MQAFLIVYGVIAVVLIFIVTRKNKREDRISNDLPPLDFLDFRPSRSHLNSTDVSGDIRKAYHLNRQPILDGHMLYLDRLNLGIHPANKPACIEFCKGREQELLIEADPSNAHDPNALRIWGAWGGGRHQKPIGYVDRDSAARIAAAHVAHQVRPRLLKTYLSTDNYVQILYQITGPKERYADFLATSTSSRDRASAARCKGDPDGEETAILSVIEDAEDQARRYNHAPTAAPYKRLATLYRKQGRLDQEIDLLERYVSWLRPPERVGNDLGKRLEKAREMQKKAKPAP